MNAVADWLFTFLLGWTGNLFNGAWRSISSNSAGLNSFFSVIWLPLLLILLFAGTAIDFIVWFIRWRPHYVWRSRALRRLAARRRDIPVPEQPDMPDQYRGQIAEWVAEEEPPLPELWESAPVEETYSGYDEPRQDTPGPETYDPALYMPALEPMPAFSDVSYQDDAPYESETPTPYAVGTADMQETVPGQPLFTPEMQRFYSSYAEPVTDNTPSPPARRRRSNRHQTAEEKPRRASLGGLLHRFSPDDEEVLEGLPPPVSQEKAFRNPVYPDSYPFRPENPPQGPQE